MPENQKPVNLGGVIEGFPFLTPEGFEAGKDTPTEMSVNDMFSTLGTGRAVGRPSIPVSTFSTGDRYLSSLPLTDTEEMVGQQQSAFDKWGNALVKMTGTAGTTLISGTAGLVYGLGASVRDGRFASLYDNEVTRSMDDFSKYLEDALPNYYTHQEQDADWYSPDNLLTANFWADKVLKNLGFSAGAIAGGVAWSQLFRAMGITNQLVKAGKALELVEATEKAMTAVPKAQRFATLQTTLETLSKKFLAQPTAAILKSSDRILTSAMATFGEASLESLHNLNDYRGKLIEKYKETYGTNPEGEDLQEINDYADKVGNFTWGGNTLLLTATNYIMLPKILGSSRKADKALINNIVKDTTGKFITPAKGFLARTSGAGALLFSPTEAFEEGSQYAIQTGTREYFERAYQNKDDVSSFFSNLTEVTKSTFGEGVEKTFGTKEGMENILIGGISGALQQIRGTLQERNVRKKNTDLALSVLNDENATLVNSLKDGVNYIARGINSQKLRQEAIADNDVLSEKDYELDYTMSYVLPRIKYGKASSILEEIQAYKNQSMSDTGFQELKNEGIVAPTESKAQFVDRLDKVIKITEESAELYSQIQDKYSNFVDAQGRKIFSDDVVDRMVYSAAKIRDYDDRIPFVTTDLVAAGVDVQSVLSSVVESNQGKKAITGKKPLKNALQQIEDLNSINEDQLKEDLRDVVELTLRRKKFVDEYNNIKRNPSAYKESPVVVKEAPVITNVNEEKEALETGKKYIIPTTKAEVKKVPNEEQWEVTSRVTEPKTYNSKEEAEQRALEIDLELADTEEVRVIQFNQDNTVQIEDKAGDIYNVPLSRLTGYERVLSEQEKFQKYAEDLEKEQKDIESQSGNTATNAPSEDIVESEEKKKATSELFASTTSPSEDRETLKPHNIRSIEFLNNAKNFANFADLKVILVTPNQEESLGLKGLTDLSMEGSGFPKNKYTDVNEGLVAAVYVEQKGETIKFVDKDGKPLTKVGETVDLNSVVFSTMPTTHLVWSDGKEARYRSGEKEQATEASKQWESKRKELFNLPPGKYETYDFSISRGIPIISDVNAKNSVGETLVPESIISKQQDLILIPTTGTIFFKGNLLKFPNGRPVLNYRDTLQFINNRNFTKKEAEAIYEVLQALSKDIVKQKNDKVKNIKLNRKYTTFLQNVLYWRKSADTKGNQIYIDSNTVELFLGRDRYDLTNLPETIVDKLQGAYGAVNNVTLKDLSKPFIEYYMEGDTLSTREWVNYQTYLLSSKLPDGKSRSNDNIPLTTSVDIPTEATPYNYKQKYAVLSGLTYLPETKEEEVEEPAEEQAEASDKYVLDGKTVNTYTSPNGNEILFLSTGLDDIRVIVGKGDLDVVLAALTKVKGNVEDAKKNIKNFIAISIVEQYPELAVDAKKEEQKPAKIEVPQAKDFSKTSAPPATEYARVGSENVGRITPSELELFKEWHAKNTPNIPYEVLENILITYDGEKAWGAFENNVAKFYKSAQKGTEYHEIFEAIWASFLTKEQQQLIIQDEKAKPGSFKDRQTNKTIKYDEATDAQIKERIADDFADFRLGKISAKSLTDRVVAFFRSIIEFFKSFVQKPSLKDELFKAIDTGEFKDLVVPSQTLAPQYRRVEGLTEQQTNDFVQDITARFFQNVFATNKSLFDPETYTSNTIFDAIKQTYSNEGKLELLGDKTWNDLVARTKDYLRTFRIEFDEDNQLTINQEGSDNRLYAPEPFTTNWKKSSPFPVKILVGTLTETVPTNQEGDLLLNTPSQKVSSVNGLKLVNFSRAFATLLNTLGNNTNIDNVVKKLYTLAKDDSNYVRLLNRLGGNKQAPYIDFDKYDADDWRLFINFYQTFTKQKPDAFVQYINNGEVYNTSASLATPVAIEKQSWIENMKNLSKKKDSIVFYNKPTKTYQVKNVSSQSIKTPQDQTKFLQKIGVEFPMEVYNRLKSSQRETFSKAVSAIHSTLDKTKDLASVTGKTLQINSQLTTLAELFVKVSNPNQDLSYFGLDGRRRQTFADNNAASVLESDFNSSDTLDELLEKRPELNDIFSQNSLILKRGGIFFDAEGKRIKSIKVGYIQGTNNVEDGRETVTSDLSIGNRYVQEINQNIDGNYYILVPADSSTEWMMNLENQVSYESVETGDAWNNIYSIFKNYLRDDINLARENRSYLLNTEPRAQELRFFNDILPQDVLDKVNDLIKKGGDIDTFIGENEEKINASIQSYIQNDVNDTIEVLKENGEIIFNNEENFSFNNLQDNFVKTEKLNKYNLSDKEVNDIITFTNTNYIINNIELHKILFGDPYQFAIKRNQLDETKRIKSFLSPRRLTFDIPEFNNFLNTEYNKAGEINLSPEDPGYHFHKSHTNTITLRDITVAGSISQMKGISQEVKDTYSKTNEADAFSIITDSTYREVKLKNGQWSEQAEDWHQWQMAYTRQNMPNYEYSSKALEKHDIELLSKPEPNYKIEVLKPIVSGNKNGKKYIDNTLDKMSQMPIYYSVVEGTNLEYLYLKMMREKIGYVVFESGRKVGAEKLDNLYTEEGKFNQLPFNTIIEVPWKAYGIQVENSYDKPKEQTRGSQITKLSSMDMADNGTFVSEQAQKEYQKNRDLLDQMHTNAYKNLLESLGIEDLEGSFKLVDSTTVSQTLQRELLRREASENLKDVIQLDENGNFPIAFEASAAYIQIRDILYSMVDKALVSPKMSGGSHVQVPVTLWESSKEGRKVVEINGKKVFTDATLKFYTKEEPYCEIMLPAWFKDQLPKNKFKTDQDILNYLNKSAEGRNILKGIGFRIPTQSMSSIEVFRVKGFLPAYMGNTVVVPSEITAKAGSDFDIDKLNLYLKAIYIDQNNDIKLVKYKGSEKETKEFYGKIFDKKNETIKFKKSELLEALQLIREGKDYTEKYDTKGLVSKYAYILNDIVNESEDLDIAAESILQELRELNDEETYKKEKDRFVKKMYKQSLENEYYDSLERLLTLPENFERLISPVNDAGLKEVSDKLDNLKGIDETTIKNRILSRNYMTSTRHAFVTGKKWVGIAAVNITGHSVSQKSEIYIDPERFELVPAFDRKWLGDGTVVLPHNVTKDGRISMSGRLTANLKQFISDRLSGYATAFVDVAKDPYILKIIKSDLAIGTFMFLERIGAGETTALFMNQPIIDEYLSYLSSINARGLYNKNNLDYIRSKFYASKDQLMDAKINISDFEGNIKKYSTSKLTDAENAVQQRILDEFLKYAKIAQYSFKLTQAYNYDTTKFRSSDTLYKKNTRTEQARQSNIFSSVDKILGSTFIGEQSYILSFASEAMGEILKLDKYDVREEGINPVLKPYAQNEFLSNEKYDRIANRVVTSFIDFVTQTGSAVNSKIKDLIVGVSAELPTQLALYKEKYPELRILRDLEIVSTDRNPESRTNSIKLKVNIKEAYDENLYTEAMRELRDFGPTNSLYKNIVTLSFLQGTYQSPISIANIIPIEDRAEILGPIIKTLNLRDYAFFADSAFQRNNWKDTDVFRKVEPKFFQNEESFMGEDELGNEFYLYTSPAFPSIPSLNISPKDRKILQLNEKYHSFDIASDFIIVPRVVTDRKTGERIDMTTGVNVTNRQFAINKAKGDYSLQDVYGYKKVKYSDGTPVTTFDKEGNKIFIYKLINLWGDGIFASEYYLTGKPSVLDNGTMKISQEVPDADIINYFSPMTEEPSSVREVNEAISQIKKEIPANKPEFNKLPFKSETPTMTYAGIGSRETPKEIQDQMTELAKELDKRGYTLRSGGAEGADKAFEKGATKKEIFLGSAKTGPRELKIAEEIHPNWPALKSDFVKNLMARNTNQVFGKDLNVPVDFVVAWTKDGLTDYRNRSIQSGGTGQAIDMASRKNIPVINLKNPNWRQDLDKALEGKKEAPADILAKPQDQVTNEDLKQFLNIIQEESPREFIMRMKDIGMFAPTGDVYSHKLDLEMPTKDINKALNDIERYNFGTAPAKRLMEKVEAMRKTGMFNLIAGSGNLTNRIQKPIPSKDDSSNSSIPPCS